MKCRKILLISSNKFLKLYFSRRDFATLYDRENQSLNDFTALEQELNEVNEAISKTEILLGRSYKFKHLIFKSNFWTSLNSEQSEAENAEMQNVQMQIKDLSDELATLEASFNSIVGGETQRQRYEDVTTDSKLRIEFADTRSMYQFHFNYSKLLRRVC